MATATAPVKKKSADTTTNNGEEAAIPAGATYMAGLHDKTKALCKHMDDRGSVQEHEEVKGFHGRFRKSLDEHLADLKGTFHKAYPDIEGLDDEEEVEPEEEEGGGDPNVKPEKETGMKSGKTQLGHKAAKQTTLPATGIPVVKSASDLLAGMATEANLTASQKAALIHASGQLASACAAAPSLEDQVDETEAVHLKALIEAAEVRLRKNTELVEQALGRK